MESVYIQLETWPSGKNHAQTIQSQVAAKHWDRLAALAREMNSKPLQDFMSGAKGPSVKWFPAGDAMATIGKLISRLTSDKRLFPDTRLILRDLRTFENILSSAAARGSRFRFSGELDSEPEVSA